MISPDRSWNPRPAAGYLIRVLVGVWFSREFFWPPPSLLRAAPLNSSTSLRYARFIIAPSISSTLPASTLMVPQRHVSRPIRAAAMHSVPIATNVCPALWGTARVRRRRSRRGATPPACQASRAMVKPMSATRTPRIMGNCSIRMHPWNARRGRGRSRSATPHQLMAVIFKR